MSRIKIAPSPKKVCLICHLSVSDEDLKVCSRFTRARISTTSNEMPLSVAGNELGQWYKSGRELDHKFFLHLSVLF